jgi:hypothetical protein
LDEAVVFTAKLVAAKQHSFLRYQIAPRSGEFLSVLNAYPGAFFGYRLPDYHPTVRRLLKDSRVIHRLA